jgi:hypothetical protein
VNERSPVDAWTSWASLLTWTVRHAAQLERQRADGRAVAGADDHAFAPVGLEAVHSDLDGVSIGRDVRENEVTSSRQPAGCRAFHW